MLSQSLNVSPNASDTTTLITGMMSLWASSTAPFGWLLCDGTAYSRTTYQALFSTIGTTFGAGDGTTTFNVPNTAGRTVRGVGTASWTGLNSGDAGTTVVTLGASAGADGTKQSADNLPQHTHGFGLTSGGARKGAAEAGGSVGVGSGGNLQLAGSFFIGTGTGQTYLENNTTVTTNSNTVTTNAYVGINYIIKY